MATGGIQPCQLDFTSELLQMDKASDFHCDRCRKIMDEPFILTCQHNFCQTCLSLLLEHEADENGVKCPRCKEDTEVKDIRRNTLLLSIKSSYNKFYIQNLQNSFDLKCNQCERDEAVNYCNDCEIYLCCNCKRTHCRMKALRNHDVVSVDKLEVKEDQSKFCSIHSCKPIVAHCIQCSAVVCVNCILKEHNGHETQSVEKALESVIPSVEKQIHTSRKERRLVKNMRDDVDRKMQETIKVLEQTEIEKKEKIKQIIDAYKPSEEKMNSAIEKGRLVKQDLDKGISSQNSLISKLSDLMKMSHGPGMLHQLTSNMQLLTDNKPDLTKAQEFLSTKSKLHLTPSVNLMGAMPETNIAVTFQSPRVTKHDLSMVNFFLQKKVKYTEQKHTFSRFISYNNALVAVCHHTECLDFYSYDLDFKKSMPLTGIKRPCTLHPLSSQILMVGGSNGLFRIDSFNGEADKILDSDIKDVHINMGHVAVVLSKDKTRYIQVLDQSDQYNVLFQVEHPHDGRALITPGKKVLVSDLKNHTITEYDLTGRKTNQYGTRGLGAPGELYSPHLCITDTRGNTLVADQDNHRLQVLTKSGPWLVQSDEFYLSSDVCFTDRHMYVKEWGSIHMFALEPL